MPVTYKWLGRNGRLGNQLWQIASTVGIAAARGDRPSFPPWEYQRYFSAPDEWFDDVTGEDGGTGYLQELHYFEAIESTIRMAFRPRFEVLKEVVGRWPEFFALEHTTAIHYRRGDYVALPTHFPLPTEKYYASAAEIISQPTTFVVFSDDIAWCRANVDLPGPMMFIEGIARPVERADRHGPPQDHYDLILQSVCNRHIISNSTFSWWGAWLSGSPEVIYPSRWFGPALRDIPWRRMIPASWIEAQC